jgi:Putative beta-barrel porin-2, OmpL-like. bbp2
LKKQWGGLLIFVLMAVLSLPALAQQQAPAQAPADASAQTPAAAPSTPQPLPNPSMTAPLSTAAPPHTFNAGPFGTVAITGILSGMGLVQNNWVPGDKSTHWDVSNAQIFLQKTSGWFQFYLQGGAYNLPSLGTPFLKTTDTLSAFYGPFPQGYIKLVKGNLNVEIGALPTLIGAEYTFTFENMNIERGVLWNQENAVNRGIQVSDTFKKLSLTASWNDGFYSNVYNWISGSAAYAFNSSNTLSFVGMGNAGQTTSTSAATPFLQNNGQIYNILYTYSHESWTITPYWQYTRVPAKPAIGILESGHTNGGAVLLNYNFKGGISLAVRPEYITSSGSATDPLALNLLGYGVGSNAFAFTVTPAYQKAGFFVRGDVSVVDARSATPGLVFGSSGLNTKQTRGMIEAGFMF